MKLCYLIWHTRLLNICVKWYCCYFNYGFGQFNVKKDKCTCEEVVRKSDRTNSELCVANN